MQESGRQRAWFLIGASDVSGVKRAIRSLDPEGTREDLVIVRVDEVSGGDHNLVVPVDAETEEGIKEVMRAINDFDQTTEPQVLRVSRHENGDAGQPPHLAAGYITESELDRDEEHSISEFDGRPFFCVVVSYGRQKGSPGHTPWG